MTEEEGPDFSAMEREVFDAATLLRCYASGVFPMGEARDDPRVFLVEPDERGIFPLDAFHIPSRLKRTVRAEPFDIRVNTAFLSVVDACAAPAAGREDTWINAPIRRLYGELHALGHAHSLECWQGETLVGGLYGVTLGSAFFGESMFSRVTDASKVALVHLVARLKRSGFTLLDAQFITPHLARFGAQEIPQSAYLRKLGPALRLKGDADAMRQPMTGADAVEIASS